MSCVSGVGWLQPGGQSTSCPGRHHGSGQYRAGVPHRKWARSGSAFREERRWNGDGTPDGGVHDIFTIAGRSDKPAGRQRHDHSTFNVGSTNLSDLAAFRAFMKFLDQPTPVSSYGSVTSDSINNGRVLFSAVGCALCHTPTLMTGASSTAVLTNKAANLFSDLAVHNMGSTLSDGVPQGAAGPDEFRTAPLWGLGQRRESEANQGIENFNGLRSSQQQDILNFLRSL
jgi:hypothetical protein